ncbi:VanZ family protein [Demequina sp. NBRC 110056]|uniref:VanZ family protein n=1 Tax=Demequina sp. NBRC 110056 TaxID=1570345 RepID=UPI0013562EEE|nr:VanZ family protein [Demequina sp. NBRC 110056]
MIPGTLPRVVVDGVDVGAPLLALGALTVVLAFAIGLARGRGVRYALWAGLVFTLAIIGLVTLGSVLTDSTGGAPGVNLVPFQEIQRGLDHRSGVAWANLVGNVLLFVPLGLAVGGLVRGGFWARLVAATATGVVLSAAIELVQYTGGRVADIDDIILNGLGALVGGVVAATAAALARPGARARSSEVDSA